MNECKSVRGVRETTALSQDLPIADGSLAAHANLEYGATPVTLLKVVVFLTALIYTQTSKRVTATITVTRDLHFRHLEIENDPK